MAAGSKTATYWNAQSVSYLPRTLVIDRKDSETVGQSKTFFVNVDTGFKYLLS